mgnify:CR=1 FL=1
MRTLVTSEEMLLDHFAGLIVVHDGVDVLEQNSWLREVLVGLDERQSTLKIHCCKCVSRSGGKRRLRKSETVVVN